VAGAAGSSFQVPAADRAVPGTEGRWRADSAAARSAATAWPVPAQAPLAAAERAVITPKTSDRLRNIRLARDMTKTEWLLIAGSSGRYRLLGACPAAARCSWQPAAQPESSVPAVLRRPAGR
jgi:hypothetical protein